MSSIICYDEEDKLISEYDVPFDVEVDCHIVDVWGNNFSGMKMRGKCNSIWFEVENYNDVDLSGFMDLEIGAICFHDRKGLLKILELNCKKVLSGDQKLDRILNKYVEEESDPLMRYIQGCKYELAINGFGDKL